MEGDTAAEIALGILSEIMLVKKTVAASAYEGYKGILMKLVTNDTAATIEQSYKARCNYTNLDGTNSLRLRKI